MKLSKKIRQQAKTITDQAETIATLEARLEQAVVVWREITGENRALAEQVKAHAVESIQARRSDLARVCALHHRVLRRANGGRRAERFFCDMCNTLWPCRTVEVAGRLNDELNVLYREAKSA